MIPALIAAGAGIVGGAMSSMGQRSANVANARMAREQMAFQERMASTQWQRGVEDIRKAGLNPALAYGQGGAAAPSGAMAQKQNTLAAAGGSAQAAAETYANIRATEAATEKTRTEAQQLRIESLARVQQIQAEAEAAATNARFLTDTYDDRRAGVYWKQNRMARAQIEKLDNENYVLAHSRDLRLEELRANIQATLSHAAEVDARTVLHRYEAPRARNLAAVENTWWGKYRPFVTDGAKALQGAANMRRGARTPPRPQTTIINKIPGSK